MKWGFNMDFDSFHHEPKSNQAYLYNADTVHIRLKVKKGIARDVRLIYGDPFLYEKDKEGDRHAWKPFADGEPMINDYDTEHHNFFFKSVKPAYRRMKYAFLIEKRYLFGAREVIDLDANPSLRHNLFNYFNFPFLNKEDLFSPPEWVKNQVWYSVFPERFANGDASLNTPGTKPWASVDTYSNDDLFGGDLKGLTDKLDYIADMGFTGLYLTPIFHAMSTHKYDTIDYHMIDPAFGDNAAFRDLVEKAHGKGIKIMLDAVFNHTGLYHPYFLDVIKKGHKSKYYDCFHIIDDNKPVFPLSYDSLMTKDRKFLRQQFKGPKDINYRTFAFTPFMPKINTMNPIMKHYLLDVGRHWIEKYDIDGWRLDVSNEIPHRFWREFRRSVKDAKPDAYIVGENWDNSNPWLEGDQYDAVMNYEILFPIWQFFGTKEDFPSYNATEFIHRINKVLTDYPKNVSQAMYNLVDSHDTARIKTICGEDERRVRLAYLFLFTYPGSPSIFYGGEIGVSGGHDPENRACMPWSEALHKSPLKDFLKRLINLRKTEADLRTVDFGWHTQRDSQVLMYEKGDLLVVMNNQDNPADVTLPEDKRNKTIEDLLLNRHFNVDETLRLSPFEAMIIK